MVRGVRRLLFSVALTALGAATAYGQSADQMTVPVPLVAPGTYAPELTGLAPTPCTGAREGCADAAPGASTPALTPGTAGTAPGPHLPTDHGASPAHGLTPPPHGPPACAPYEDKNGPLLKGHPLLDEPSFAPPGWFGAVEVDVVGPHIKNRLVSTFPVVPGGVEQVHLPTAALDWTGAPRFELGYRLAQGAGEVLLAYRFVVTAGSETLPGFGPGGEAGALHSRLDVQVLDLDYGGREYSLLPRWDMKWLAGFRLGNVFFDSRAAGPLLVEHTSNTYYGGGPHVRLDLWRHPGPAGLALFGRLDLAYLLFGEVRQHFEEAVTGPGAPAGGELRETHNQPAPVVGVQAGVDWRVTGNPQLSFAAGYTFERWFVIGDVQQSHGDLTIQGVFLRGEYQY
jgi:hypothetical protein